MARNTNVIAMTNTSTMLMMSVIVMMIMVVVLLMMTILCIVFFGRGDASGKAVYEPTKATQQ